MKSSARAICVAAALGVAGLSVTACSSSSESSSATATQGAQPAGIRHMDGTGNGVVTGLSSDRRYFVSMSCTGSGSLAALNRKGAAAMSVPGGCGDGNSISYDLTPSLNAVTAQGDLELTAPSNTQWSIDVWEHA